MFTQSNAQSSPCYLNPSHVSFLLKSCDIKEASGKLVKAASDIVSVPLLQIINNNLWMGYSQMLGK